MNYIDITSPDINNGLGCRVTLWISGCPFHCKGCHNKEYWDKTYGKPFKIDDVYNIISVELNKPYIKGLTLCGGEPLVGKTNDELKEIHKLLELIKQNYPEKDIWVYSGATFEELIDNNIYFDILRICDVLVDGQYIEDKRNVSLPFRGSSNQRLIDLNKTISNNKICELQLPKY